MGGPGPEEMSGIKAVIVGDGAIGKTCLVAAIKDPTQELDETYQPTIAENETFQWTHGDESVEVDFWDTAGQEAFQALRRMAYSGANVILVGFDMTEPASLENIVGTDEGWMHEVLSQMPDFDHWVLVGTKHDIWEKKGGVTEEDIFKAADKLQPKNIIYTSAYTKLNCKEVQEEILRVGLANFKANPVPAWTRPCPAAPAAPAADDKPAVHVVANNGNGNDEDKEGCCSMM